MIWIYTQGSKKLGLGHLSRVVPLYHEMCILGYEIEVLLFGDELGAAYLKNFGVTDFSHFGDDTIETLDIHREDSWIIDATDFFHEKVPQWVEQAKSSILISPRFDKDKAGLIQTAFIRSDPFQLPITNKFVHSNYFLYNTMTSIRSSKGSVGIALSGGDSSLIMEELVSALINSDQIGPLLSKLHVFLGASTNVNFERKQPVGYGPGVIFYSTLDSLWNYVQGVDLLIVGNGMIVDECIREQKDFIVYAWDPNNRRIKSGSKKLVAERMCFDLDTLIEKLNNQLKGNSGSLKKLNSSGARERPSQLVLAIDQWFKTACFD